MITKKSIGIFLLLTVFLFNTAADVERVKYISGDTYVIIEFLDDDLVHVELSAIGSPTDSEGLLGPDTSLALKTTPMVYKTDYDGPLSFSRTGDTLETDDIKVEVDPGTLVLTFYDKTKTPQLKLTEIHPLNLDLAFKGIQWTKESFTHAYGLGQQFRNFTAVNPSDGDWVGYERTPGTYGNQLIWQDWDDKGGAQGNTQFPILYALGPDKNCYALFMDNHYKQNWDLTGSPWQAEMWGDWLRYYIMTGPDLPDLRQDYMELTGTPPVPPKKAFGLWVSEYGYDNWGEIDYKLSSLRSNAFPVDGFVLDLQWFGGISNLGTLSWNVAAFPSPEDKIEDYLDTSGVGLITIEEPYVQTILSEYSDLETLGYLVKESETGSPVHIVNAYWGEIAMMDWTEDDASAYWHDTKREALITQGILGHWTDLGEPEMYDDGAWYAGIPGDHKELHNHGDVHNLYNLLWTKSIFEGYARNGHEQRPFSLARSGAPGIQRYGAVMWSGDIGAFYHFLKAQHNAQMHLSLSGIDYYGGDIGGFHKPSAMKYNPANFDNLYTQWFANSCLLDVPIRPHTDNLDGTSETSPDQVGNQAANRENLRERYELSPYIYSLAHRAHNYGEPVFPPLVYYFQEDLNLRQNGSEKMIGPSLLVATESDASLGYRDVYLPEGTWIDHRTHNFFTSSGETVGSFALYPAWKFKLPLFARSGAILPLMHVDEQTMNILGKRLDGSIVQDLVVKIFCDEEASSFTLYEDDGRTIRYESADEVCTTEIEQQRTGETVAITIHATLGSYTDAPTSRNNLIYLIVPNRSLATVTLNGPDLTVYSSAEDFEAASSGAYFAGMNTILIKSGEISVSTDKTFVVTLQPMSTGFGIDPVLRLTGEVFSDWNPDNVEYILKQVGDSVWETRLEIPTSYTATPYKITLNGTWDINWGGGASGSDAYLSRSGSNATVDLSAGYYRFRITEGGSTSDSIHVEWIAE